MNFFALFLVLNSSVLHAFWNFYTKKSEDKLAFIWLTMLAILGLYFLPSLLFWRIANIAPDIWLWTTLSGFFQASYCVLLSGAYTYGDLSIVYPLIRGVTPILVALVANIILKEHISFIGGLGIIAIVIGIYILHLNKPFAFNRKMSSRQVFGPIKSLRQKGSQFALLTGIASAAYHLIDKRGVRETSPIPYLYLTQIFIFLFLSGFMACRGRWEKIKFEWRRRRGTIILVAVFSFASYLLVLFAMTFSKVSYVAAVRNFSIVIGVVLGAILLKERYFVFRLSGAILIVMGIILIAIKG